MTTSRQRLQATIEHRQPDRVVVDIGGNSGTDIHASTLSKLRYAVLGEAGYRVKVRDLLQMLGEIDDELRPLLPTDVVKVVGAKTPFGSSAQEWKPWQLPDGTLIMMPGGVSMATDANGDFLMYPKGDTTAPPSARMPKTGFYFDVIVRQPPIDEDALDPSDNFEDFSPISADDLADYASRVATLVATCDYGVTLVPAGLKSYGLDNASGAGPGIRYPKGIRAPEEWYMSLVTRKDYIHAVFEHQTEVALANIARLAEIVGSIGQVVRVCSADFGGQQAPLISRQTYRELFSPYYRRINAALHEQTNWKTFKHCCGSIIDLIPDLIEDGFDILGPVQTSAARMDPRVLKREFGDQVVFWGGGVDTQRTMPFGTPEEVYREVRERIDIFNVRGGFVFGTVHNLQANVPIPNVLAMFQAIRDSWAND
jgi:Uroporphyrinogen decarboxylase (URO-D)